MLLTSSVPSAKRVNLPALAMPTSTVIMGNGDQHASQAPIGNSDNQTSKWTSSEGEGEEDEEHNANPFKTKYSVSPAYEAPRSAPNTPPSNKLARSTPGSGGLRIHRGQIDTHPPQEAEITARSPVSGTTPSNVLHSGNSDNPTTSNRNETSSTTSGHHPSHQRDLRHKEWIRKISGEIAVLKDDIVETRNYALEASCRAQQTHAELLKAERRARLAEEEQARLQNELEAERFESERRRKSMKEELDLLVQRLKLVEDARDAAERQAREILLQESSKVRKLERELTMFRNRLLRNNTPTSPSGGPVTGGGSSYRSRSSSSPKS